IMLRHLGEEKAAVVIEKAVISFLRESPAEDLPWEFGGKAFFTGVGDAIAERAGGGDRIS
ncbi:MAG: isocitrate/isopropylmalate dehydrogenase family protein, partial [Thermovirgaceae bacterium]|nr:isocitrate/isopropylmalate dehydrogenase family protein [Thermovirgaceae bacterium]